MVLPNTKLSIIIETDSQKYAYLSPKQREILKVSSFFFFFFFFVLFSYYYSTTAIVVKSIIAVDWGQETVNMPTGRVDVFVQLYFSLELKLSSEHTIHCLYILSNILVMCIFRSCVQKAKGHFIKGNDLLKPLLNGLLVTFKSYEHVYFNAFSKVFWFMRVELQ